MNDIERRFQECLNQIEFENSYKSDHEMRIEKDKKMSETVVDDDTEVSITQTAQDFEDACKQEYDQFKFASRITGIYLNLL